MQTLEITQAELNKLEYNDLCIKQMKTPEQKYMIEKKEHEKRIRKRNKLISKANKRVKNEPKLTFINDLMKFVEEKDITPAMIEKEVEMWFNWLI